jgi:hypothetical protein
MNTHPSYTLGSPAGDWPDAARLGGAFARHLLRTDLSHRRGADRSDVVLHRRRLSPRRLLRAGRRAGGEPLRRLQRLPRRIPAGEFLCLPAARPAHGPLVERDLRLPARARLSGADQRRLFARLDRAVLHRDLCRTDRAALRDRAPDGARALGRPRLRAAHLPHRHRAPMSAPSSTATSRGRSARVSSAAAFSPRSRQPPRHRSGGQRSSAILPRLSPASAASSPMRSCC